MKRGGNEDSHSVPQSTRYRVSSGNSGGNSGGDAHRRLTAQEREINRSKDYLFSTISSSLRNSLQLDSIAIFSVTEGNLADQMTTTIIKHLNCHTKPSSEYILLDGMACVGGNTISFAKSFKRILSNELNKERFEMLRNNVQQVLNYSNVELFNLSILDLAFQQEENSYDILFLDPEWGGPEYKFKKNLKLTISDKPLEEFCLDIFQKCLHVEMIALKLPVNYDNRYLRDVMRAKNVTYIFDNTFEKMTSTLLL